MFEKIGRWFRARRDPERMREDEEARLRAQQEIRQAEQAKSEEQRGYEGASERPPYFRP